VAGKAGIAVGGAPAGAAAGTAEAIAAPAVGAVVAPACGVAPPSADLFVVYSDVTCRVSSKAMAEDGLAVLWEDVVLET